MSDRVTELEAKVADLAGALRRLEGRLEVVERASARAPAARRAVAVDPGGLQAVAAAPRADVPSGAAAMTWIGRTLLVLAGAFVLRALTDAGTLAAPLGVGLGLAHAGTWIALADRAGRAGARWSAGFHGAAAVIIGFPLLFESTFRFRLLSPGAAAGLLAALTAVALAVAARRRLEGLAWLVSLAGAATAVMLALAPLSGRALLPSIYLVLLGGATLWLGYVLDWHGPRWPVALAADALVAIMAVRAVSPGATEGPGAAFLAQVALLVVFLGSFAARTILLGRNVVAFEVAQTAGALAAGLGGAAFVAARGGGGAGAFGAAAIVLGLAAYGVAFAFVERRGRAPANFTFYASVALVLALAGTALVLPGAVLPATWATFALVAAALARRHHRRILAIHACLYAVAAAAGSGLLGIAVEASFAPPGASWTPVPPLALAVLAALAVTAVLTSGATVRAAPHDRVPQLVLVGVTAFAASGVLVAALVPPLAGAPPAASAGAVATIRTAAWVAGALLLGALGRRDAWREASWLVYPVLAATGFKILLEDLPRSRPATLFLAFALYGAALIAAARGRGRQRARVSAEP